MDAEPRVCWLTYTSPRITLPMVQSADFIVSYNYRHRIMPDICEAFDGRAINLHISMLPWNRGAHPNVWSWIDGTPKGISIHHINEGFDTGDLIAQEEISMTPSAHTLRTSYDYLHMRLRGLFARTWPDILAGKTERRQQVGLGSTHLKKDLQSVHLPWGWDTPVSILGLTGLSVRVG